MKDEKKFIYSRTTVELTFKPLVADLRYEYFDALASNRKWKARWIYIRYFWYFVNAMGLNKLFSMLASLNPFSAQKTDK